MSETAWSILPPIITIVLALLTKEVHFALIIGIFSGALIFSKFNILMAIDTMFTVIADSISTNIFILMFVVMLGTLVVLVNVSGAVKAYGAWGAKAIKTPKSSLLITAILGSAVFVDYYFNCLTVGALMRPITDKFNITRVKLAYILDATAAFICTIMPISSWAAALSMSLPANSPVNSFSLFLDTIPFNFYAFLAFFFMVFSVSTGRDFFTMAEYQREHGKEIGPAKSFLLYEIVSNGNGKIIDIIIPLSTMIISCLLSMLYTGGILDGNSVTQALIHAQLPRSLAMGGAAGVTMAFIIYIPRKIVDFKTFCEAMPHGFRIMAPMLLIFALAWSLSGICGAKYLNIGAYISHLMQYNSHMTAFLPAIFFILSLCLSFSIGTFWGTLSIIVPMVIHSLGIDSSLFVVSIAAVISGSVAGDHMSLVSTITIAASIGAQCEHMDHMRTQIPYALALSACALLGYLASGITASGWFGMLTAAISFLIMLVFIYHKSTPAAQ